MTDYPPLTKEARERLLQQMNNQWKQRIEQMEESSDLRWLYVSDKFKDHLRHLIILGGQWLENHATIENPYYEIFTSTYGTGKIIGRWGKHVAISRFTQLQLSEVEAHLLMELMEELNWKELLIQLDGENWVTYPLPATHNKK